MFRHGARFFTFALFLSLSGPGIASEVAPDFNLRSPEGRRIHLKTFLQDGPVLLDFWATWCKPCVKTMPKLQRIYDKYREKGLTVVGVNEDGPRGQSKVKPFLRARNLTFLIALDLDGGLLKRMRVNALPATVLVDTNGEIVFRQEGFSQKLEEKLVKVIDAILVTSEGVSLE